MTGPLLEVKHLKQYFKKGRAFLRAVDDVNFAIPAGETLGMVGESGSGKSTVARAVLRLYDPTAGEIWFDGENLAGIHGRRLKEVRRKMQIVFQDPLASLPPNMPAGRIVTEPLRIQGISGKKERREEAERLLDLVGVGREFVDAFPHEFSGGQQQRIGIARALSLRPKFVVLDEPVSALDVSIQAQILNLLERLQQEYGLTYLFIAHNLAVVEHISTRVCVMYLGKLMETAPTAELYQHPLHPYTQALLSAVPQVKKRGNLKNRIMLEGEVPSPINPPAGCRFSTRCRLAVERCQKEELQLREVAPGHQVACHLVQS